MAISTGTVFGVATCTNILSACKTVYDCVEQITRKGDCCDRVKRSVLELQELVLELQQLEAEDVSESCQQSVVKLQSSLTIATQVCQFLNWQMRYDKLHNDSSYDYSTDLNKLDCELTNARDSVRFALQRTYYQQVKMVKKDLIQDSKETRRVITHPKAGIYENPQGHKASPHPVKKPSVYLDQTQELMILKWEDRKNDINNTSYYEVSYKDDKRDGILAFKPENIISGSFSWGSKFTLRLGEPVVRTGNQYNVMVRAVNGAGPGEWSEACTIRFYTCPPDKPQAPFLTVLSATEILVEVKELSSEEEHGSRVTRCIIEYTDLDEENAAGWNSLKCTLRNKNVLLRRKLNALRPHTLYRVRVRMVNEIGTSPPSDSRRARTKYLVPGPPTNVRITNKQKNSLTVSWDKPTKNVKGVHKYKVRYRRVKIWREFATVDRTTFSFKLKKLAADALYVVRVQSANEIDEGDTADVVAKTEPGAFAHFFRTMSSYLWKSSE